jgi:anaerobic selenocysteine-containing dehydrogenase
MGFEDFAEAVRALVWEDLVRRSGISRADMEKVAADYAGSNATIACYGMRLTQHRYGVETVQLLCTSCWMRGNVGKPGDGLRCASSQQRCSPVTTRG